MGGYILSSRLVSTNDFNDQGRCTCGLCECTWFDYSGNGCSSATAEKLVVPILRLALGQLRAWSPSGNAPVCLQCLPGTGSCVFNQTSDLFASSIFIFYKTTCTKLIWKYVVIGFNECANFQNNQRHLKSWTFLCLSKEAEPVCETNFLNWLLLFVVSKLTVSYFFPLWLFWHFEQ